MKPNPSIIALKDFENICNTRLSLARYSTAKKGPEYKRKWMIQLKSDLRLPKFVQNMTPRILSNFRFVHNINIPPYVIVLKNLSLASDYGSVLLRLFILF